MPCALVGSDLDLHLRCVRASPVALGDWLMLKPRCITLLHVPQPKVTIALLFHVHRIRTITLESAPQGCSSAAARQHVAHAMSNCAVVRNSSLQRHLLQRLRVYNRRLRALQRLACAWRSIQIILIIIAAAQQSMLAAVLYHALQGVADVASDCERMAGANGRGQ